MADKNFMRKYTLKAGKKGKTGFMIGNISNDTREVLHVAFSIEKSNEENPNDAKVQIWNLSDQNIDILEQKNCKVELRAGYTGSMPLVLSGTVSSTVTIRENADRMTEIQVVDGLAELRDTVITVSVNGKVNCKDLYKKVARKMGVSIVFAKDLTFKTLPNGFSYVGKAKTILQKIAKCCGHKWTIQNNVIQVTMPGRAISAIGYLLSSETGLIGTPKKITIGSGKEEKTGWEVEYLMNGAIGPNDIVELRSSTANGYYLVNKVTMDGDNMEGDWICTAQILKIAAKSKMDKKANAFQIKGGKKCSTNLLRELRKPLGQL